MSEANDIEIFATVVGQFFAFYDQNDVQRGQFDLKGSRVKCLSPVEVKNLKAKFVIGLYGSSGTPWLVCALSEADRDIWMDVLNHQIEEFKDDNRAFLSGGEVVRGVALVRKGGRFGTSKFRLLLTNHPRVLLIDSEKMVIKEELRWESDSLPRFVLGEDSNFNIVQGERELKLKMEPGGRGIDAWQKMFLNIAKLRSFRLRFSREPVVIGMSGKLPEDLERLDWIELSSRVSLTSIPSEWQALGDPGKLAPVMLYDSSDIGSGIDAIEHVSVGRRAQSTDVSSLQASFLAAKESPKSAKFSIDDLPSDKIRDILSFFRQTMLDTKTATTATVAQILQLDVSVELKKEAMRQLSMMVQTVSGVLDGLIQRGLTNGFDEELVRRIGGVAREMGEQLTSLVSQLSSDASLPSVSPPIPTAVQSKSVTSSPLPQKKSPDNSSKISETNLNLPTPSSASSSPVPPRPIAPRPSPFAAASSVAAAQPRATAVVMGGWVTSSAPPPVASPSKSSPSPAKSQVQIPLGAPKPEDMTNKIMSNLKQFADKTPVPSIAPASSPSVSRSAAPTTIATTASSSPSFSNTSPALPSYESSRSIASEQPRNAIAPLPSESSTRSISNERDSFRERELSRENSKNTYFQALGLLGADVGSNNGQSTGTLPSRPTSAAPKAVPNWLNSNTR